MRSAAAILALLVVASPVLAGQSTPSPQPKTGFGALRPAQPDDPYRRLFATQQVLKRAVAEAGKAAPKIVCGMMVVPADPSIDPKIGVTPNTASGAEFKIRGLEPPICNPAK